MTDKFIGYFRLLEACAQPGCPVCRCLVAESRHYLDALLYEQVTDPETRGAIRRSWGLCNWHTWMLPEVASSAFGAAILCEDLVTRVLRRTQGRRRGSHPGGLRGWLAGFRRRRGPSTLVELWQRRTTCPACAQAAETEARYLDTLVTFVDDDALCAAYERSDALCVPHVVLAVERGGDDRRVETLVRRTRARWARIGEDLAGFVRKHDHRNREPYTEAEAAACARAFEMLAGARGVFGHPARRSTSSSAPQPSR